MQSEKWEAMTPKQRIRALESNLVNYRPEDVDYAFAGLNQVSDDFRVILARTMSKLPTRVVDWAADNILFVSSDNDSYAFFLPREEWNRKRNLVFLSEILKDQTTILQAFYVAHEIAHVKLRHRSPIFSDLSQEETDAQETDANDLARKWLSGG